MTFDPQALLNNAGVLAAINAAIKSAYEQGAQDGIDRIVQAARAPAGPAVVPQTAAPVVTAEQPATPPRKRAKRGLLPVVMNQMLSEHPGLTTQQYVDKIGDYDQTVKANSVGNELRRGDGTRYERRGKGWFVKNSEIEAEARPESETSASIMHSTEGSHYGAALVE